MKLSANHRSAARLMLLSAASAAVLGTPIAVRAQTAQPADVTEVVVTAQRREEKLQDVPISVAVLGGEKLDASADKGVMEILNRVPGVATFEGFQTGGATIAVRGVAALNNIQLGSSPIGYYIDTVPFGTVRTALTPDLSAYDLNRVEVLRGPQGTLYGASAVNGVVRVLTHPAEFGKYAFKARAGLSSLTDGGMGYRGDAALNVPFGDKAAGRLVLGYQKTPGWIDKPFDKDANSGTALNARLRLDAQPTEALTLSLSGWVSRTDAKANAAGIGGDVKPSIVKEPIAADFDMLAFKAAYDFPLFTVTSATSFLDYQVNSQIDTQVATQAVSGTNQLITNIGAEIFAEEISINSTHEGPWRWSAGTMYRDATDTLKQLRFNTLGQTVAPYVQPSLVDFNSKSISVFGEITRSFADGLFELTGGLRYFRDEVNTVEKLRFTGPPANFPATSPQGKALTNTDKTFKKVSPRVVASLHPSERLTAYASYAEGFRSGADQLPSALINDPTLPPAKPDNLKNYEVGFKGDLLDRTLSYEAAVFYMDWQDVQVFYTIPVASANLPALINATSASGPGADFALTWRPVSGLTVGGSLGYNNLRVDADVRNAGANTVVQAKGERLPNSPKYTASADVGYKFPLGSGLDGELNLSANYTSPRYFVAAVGTGYRADKGADPWNIGARFTVASVKGWRVALYGDNLFDRRGYLVPIKPAFPNENTRIRPRLVGIQFDYEY